MSSKEIVEEFPDNQMIRQVMDGKKLHAFRSRQARGVSGADRAHAGKTGEEGRRKPHAQPSAATATKALADIRASKRRSAATTAKTAEELAAAASRQR